MDSVIRRIFRFHITAVVFLPWWLAGIVMRRGAHTEHMTWPHQWGFSAWWLLFEY